MQRLLSTRGTTIMVKSISPNNTQRTFIYFLKIWSPNSHTVTPGGFQKLKLNKNPITPTLLATTIKPTLCGLHIILGSPGPVAKHVFWAFKKSVKVRTNLSYRRMMFCREGATSEKALLVGATGWTCLRQGHTLCPHFGGLGT